MERSRGVRVKLKHDLDLLQTPDETLENHQAVEEKERKGTGANPFYGI